MSCFPWGAEYTKVRLIAKGGFCTVYEATKRGTKERVAIKKIRLDGGTFMKRATDKLLRRPPPVVTTVDVVKDEVNVLQQLSQAEDDFVRKFVVGYIDAFRQDHKFWIVTEYVKPRDLRAIINTATKETGSRIAGPLRYKTLPIDLVSHLLGPVVEAVRFLQHEGFAHRDIKESNILVTESGVPKLCDFGCVKPASSEIDGIKVVEGEGIGTPYYVAPEVLTEKICGRNCDVWALGITALAILKGEDMFYENSQRVMWSNYLGRNMMRFLTVEAAWLDADHEECPVCPDGQSVLYTMAGINRDDYKTHNCTPEVWDTFSEFLLKSLILKKSERADIDSLARTRFVRESTESWMNMTEAFHAKNNRVITMIKSSLNASKQRVASKDSKWLTGLTF